MGNSMGFIMKHGKRLKNRYNAQYRAIEFIGKENRPSAPRHPIIPANEIVEAASQIQDFQKKDLSLDGYLKGVYVRSHDEIPDDSQRRNNPERPLPESREPRPIATFIEPESVEKGWCTITQISEFLASHEEDPGENNTAAIAKKYSLEEKKVENTIKYFTVFRVYDRARDTVLREEVRREEKQTLLQQVEEVKLGQKKAEEFRKQLAERFPDNQSKQGSPDESDKGRQPVEKAIKN